MGTLSKKVFRTIDNIPAKAAKTKFKIGENIAIVKKRKIYNKVKWTAEQTAEFNDYWKKWGGVKPYWHKLYQSINGVFNVKYFPEKLYSTKLEPMLNPWIYSKVFSDKNMIDLFWGNVEGVNIPRRILSKMNTSYYDGEGNYVSLNKAVEIVNDIGKCIIKPTVDSSSGQGVKLLNFVNGVDELSGESAKSLIERRNDSFVVQEIVEDVSHVHNRLPEARGVAGNRENGTDGFGALSEENHAGDKDCGTDADGDGVDAGPYQVVAAHGVHPGVAAVVGKTCEYFGVLVLAGENLGDACADDVLLQVGVEVRVFVGNPLPCAALPVFNPEQESRKERNTAHNHEGHLHIYNQHEDDNQNQVDHLQDDVDETVREHIRNGVYIVNDTNQNLAVRPVIVVLERQLLQMCEQIFADVVDDALGHADHQFRPQKSEEDTDGEDEDQEPAQEEQIGLVRVRDGIVNRFLRKDRR